MIRCVIYSPRLGAVDIVHASGKRTRYTGTRADAQSFAARLGLAERSRGVWGR